MHIDIGLQYTQEQIFSVDLADEPIEVVSKPGLPDWDQLLPSTELLAKNAVFKPTDHVLLFGSHHGALSVFLARHLSEDHLWITDNDVISLDMTAKTLTVNMISGVGISKSTDIPHTWFDTFDTVLIQIPKGRSLLRRWLVQATYALKEGGNIYIAGSNKIGIHSAIKDAQSLFGIGQILAYKKGNRVARFHKGTKQPQRIDWVDAGGIAPGTWTEFIIKTGDLSFPIRSLPGVFSYDHLDPGTEMLLEAVDIKPGVRVLDVGCGYGIIGLFALSRGAAWTDLIDNNLLATAACIETLAMNQITQARVFSGDLLEPVEGNSYDLILSNPPFHSGQAVDYQIAKAMIRQAFHALTPGGQLTIVANRFIPYNHLMDGVFENVSCLAESGKFHVLSGIKLE